VPANVKAVGARTEDYLGNDCLRSDELRRRPVRNRPDLIVLDPPRAGAGDAGQGYRPLSGGRVPHRGSTLIRSLPPDLSHRIGDAAGALTSFTSSKFDLRGPRSSPALALRELSFSTTEELEPQ